MLSDAMLRPPRPLVSGALVSSAKTGVNLFFGNMNSKIYFAKSWLVLYLGLWCVDTRARTHLVSICLRAVVVLQVLGLWYSNWLKI